MNILRQLLYTAGVFIFFFAVTLGGVAIGLCILWIMSSIF